MELPSVEKKTLKCVCSKEGTRLAEEWVKAPEFVPSFGTSRSNISAEESASTTGAPTSYARAVCSSGQTSNSASEPLCPYAEASGICKKIDCPYLHGITCEMCGRAALHPFNDELRQQHTNVSFTFSRYSTPLFY